LRELRELCANFPLPPRGFRRVSVRGTSGYYLPEKDIVAIDPQKAAGGGWGNDDGYYVVLLHELLHATGHASRLARTTVGDYSDEGYALEEGTVFHAQRIVLEEIGFHAEALDWHAPAGHGFPVDPEAAGDAAAWIMGAPGKRP
jgi:antirestriction protein ArdC